MPPPWCSRCGKAASVLAVVGDELLCIDCSGERGAVEGYQEAFDAFMAGRRATMPRMSDFLHDH